MFHVKQPKAGVVVSRETLERLETFCAVLLQWNKTINLISRRDQDQLWERHIADSLQLLPWFPADLREAIDLGSGGGLPGIVLAIASGTLFHLVEADQRKAEFLREVSRRTGAQTAVHAIRIEDAELPRVRLVTARALAPLDILIGLASPLLAESGVLLALKGKSVAAELTVARQRWQMNVRQVPSTTDATATILQISGVHRVRQSH